MKKSSNDLHLTEGPSGFTELPKVHLNCLSQNGLDFDELNPPNSNGSNRMVKSQTTPNLRKREHVLQSDL